MAPIRKGDGTPLEMPGVQQVRSGDGRVFFDGDAIPDTSTCRPQDDNSGSTGSPRGHSFKTLSAFNEVGYQISANVGSDHDIAWLLEFDDDAEEFVEVKTKDISGTEGGDTFSLEHDYETGIEYVVEIGRDDGNNYDFGFFDGEPDYPITGDDIELTGDTRDGGDDVTGEADSTANIVCIGDSGL